MAFAQLTYRESSRDIEACLAAQAGKLYHMGIAAPVARSTLADANELRDWRIYFEFAQRLIAKARALYAGDDFGVELTNTEHALDAKTIDLCLSKFPWKPFRSAKAAVKLHTLLDLRGSIPTFIDISDGKLHEVNVLDLIAIEAGAFYIMDRRIRIRIRFHDPDTDQVLVFLTNQFTLPAMTICALYKCRWQVELFFKWITQHLRIKRFYDRQFHRGLLSIDEEMPDPFYEVRHGWVLLS